MKYKQILKMMSILVFSLTLNAQEPRVTLNVDDAKACPTNNCEIIKSEIYLLLQHKYKKFSQQMKKQDINTTAISFEVDKIINKLEKEGENNICIKTFTQMMKIPYENFINYQKND